MPGQTPHDFPGELLDEGIILDDLPSGSLPTQSGEIRFVSGSFIFRDEIGLFNPRPSGTFGITEQQHEELDTLAHFQVKNSFEEVVYSGQPPRIASITTWNNITKDYKMQEDRFSYTGRRLTTIVSDQFVTGTLIYSLSESISYVDPFSNRVANVTRTRI